MFALTLFILLAMLGVMSTGWAFQRHMGNGGWADVFWTYGTGFTCAVAALVPACDRQCCFLAAMAGRQPHHGVVDPLGHLRRDARGSW